MISIHAPRVGSDYLFVQRAGMSIISIHAPRVGSDPRADRSIFYQHLHFNPRSPCGERPHRQPVKVSAHGISIHAPRVGSDADGTSVTAGRLISIHAPRVGSDDNRYVDGAYIYISIHAPRVGSDFICCYCSYRCLLYFNPRSPCGERRNGLGADGCAVRDFNPRSPCGERLGLLLAGEGKSYISIHAPRVGSDITWVWP